MQKQEYLGIQYVPNFSVALSYDIISFEQLPLGKEYLGFSDNFAIKVVFEFLY